MIPRSEYPRPQFVRREWLCLNGEWQFEADCGDSGLERGLRDRELTGKILVPFCPESELSGIGNVDFMHSVWYRRTVEIPANWAGQRVLLHFQAVDYDTTVWVNGKEVARHRGGFTPFTCDLSGVADGGETATIVVRARDDKSLGQPRGKQSTRYGNQGCHYTRTTGIWQTVWMEPVPKTSLGRTRITPDIAGSRFLLEQPIAGNAKGLRLRAVLSDCSGVVAQAECAAESDFAPRLDLGIPAERRRLWELADPHLYDLEIALIDAGDDVVDKVMSYAGLRGVTIDGLAVKINGKSIFQRLVLDQGYYHDGIMTAPSDEALVKDIEISMAAGFNGARLHQKVFEERFLYHADRLGYLVWGEFGDWGADPNGSSDHSGRFGITFASQWLEVLARDYSHPSIVGWCPLNETWQPDSDRITDHDDATRALFLATKAMDTTRPVLDTSGYAHRVIETDIYDSHDYNMSADFWKGQAEFIKRHEGTASGAPFINDWHGKPQSVPYGGQPYFVSEFGGIRWHAANQEDYVNSWGYGDVPANMEEFYRRFAAQCTALLENPGMFGYCYTQLTDVFQEENGVFNFDRSAKFDMERISAIQRQVAAIEQSVADSAVIAKPAAAEIHFSAGEAEKAAS
jgi:beta-galactosidase/beta-glucuronidase